MIEEAKQAVKNEEEDDLDGPISAISRKSLMKMEPIFKDGLDDDDDVPLAFSSAKRKKLSNPSKLKKEEPEDDEDEKPLKKMEGLKKRLSDSSKVKKEEREDDEDEKPLKKKEVLKNVSKPKIVKKEVLMDSEEEDEGNKKSRKRKRTEEKRTVVKLRKVEASKKLMNGKKEKKAYELPGQKHDPPELRDPLRIFYETLYDKVPTSEMAAIWMMERGLLSLEEAQKVYAKKLRKTHNQKFGSPAKGTTTPVKKSSTISVKEVKVTSKTAVKTTKKKVMDSDDDDDDDDDFVLTKLGKKKKLSS